MKGWREDTTQTRKSLQIHHLDYYYRGANLKFSLLVHNTLLRISSYGVYIFKKDIETDSLKAVKKFPSSFCKVSVPMTLHTHT